MRRSYLVAIADGQQLDIHGVYLNSEPVNGGRRGIPRLLPLLSTSITFVNGDIAITPWGWTWDQPARAPAERPWEAKRDKLFWVRVYLHNLPSPRCELIFA